jgi:hypothetical protein
MSALSVVVEPTGPGHAARQFSFFAVRTLERWADRPQNACSEWRVTVHEPNVSHSFVCRSVDLASRCERAGLQK